MGTMPRGFPQKDSQEGMQMPIVPWGVRRIFTFLLSILWLIEATLFSKDIYKRKKTDFSSFECL